MAKQYLKNLDGLRFVAAAIVAVSHLETIKSYAFRHSFQNRFIVHAPQIAVTFFFVLSGFLIMWWFLEETKGNLKKINILHFYTNRVSRTWPLYFLVVFASIAISLGNGTWNSDPLAVKRFVAYLLFLPNTADVLFRPDIYLGPAWSLAVEEFFYFFFPLFLVALPKLQFFKYLAGTCILFLVLSILFNPIFLRMAGTLLDVSTPPKIVTIFFERYRIYSFLLGASSAWLLYSDAIGKWNMGRKTQNLMVTVVGTLAICLTLFGVTFSFVTQQLYAVLFAFLLLLLTYRGYANRLLNSDFFRWGGKISYGIYMLHMLVVLRLVNQLSFLINFENRLLSIAVSWMLLLLLTCLVAHLSFHFFELPVRQWLRSRSTQRKGET